jgi:hypothetical protein
VLLCGNEAPYQLRRSFQTIGAVIGVAAAAVVTLIALGAVVRRD